MLATSSRVEAQANQIHAVFRYPNGLAVFVWNEL